MDGLLDTNALLQYAQAQGLLRSNPVAPSPNIGDGLPDAGVGKSDRADNFASRFDAAPQMSDVPLPRARPQIGGDTFANRWPNPGEEMTPPPFGLGSAAVPSGSAPMSFAPSADKSPAPVPQTSFLGRLGDALGANSNTLLALGAGMAGAPSLGIGLSRGFAAAIPARQADIKQQQQNATVAALLNRGLPPADAMAIASNPTLMQQVAAHMFGPKQMTFTQIGEDMFGNKKFGFVDPVSGTVKPLAGSSPFGNEGAATGAAGVKEGQINPNLVGEEYLSQFPQEVQAAVKDYVQGRSMPTGNPRAGFTQAVQMIAQKYGNDIGMPADATNFTARRQMRNDLSKGTPGSLGGQLTFAGTSLGHLGDVAEKASDMNNVSGFGIAPLAELANKMRGLTTDQATKVNETQGAVQHYGQEITKFYTGSPGGEAERMRFLGTMNTAKSPQEIAGAIRTERDLIPDRVRQVVGQIAERLGPEEARRQLARVNIDGAVAKINAALAKLDPNGPEAKMAKAEAVPTAASGGGKPQTVMQNGHTYTLQPDGTYK